MWWLARKDPAGDARPRDAVVVSVTSPLNRQTALDLARQVERMPGDAPVVIDLTAIPSFDSDGADALLELQEAHGDRRLSIVGFRQATARLVGPVDAAAPEPGSAASDGWVLRRLRNLVVVQPVDPEAPAAAQLDDAIAAAAANADAAIIVVDLRGVTEVAPAVVEAIAFASSTAALRGQELLVVNVGASMAESLRVAGLSATTFVAPEPPLGNITS
jgi:anti-anti-sigma regulatory factor